MSFIAPLLPDSAPFSPLQRAWLDGYVAALSGAADGLQEGGVPPVVPDAAAEPEDFPWHDPTLALDERLAVADGRAPARRLMAAMAQLDCGQCGYLCQTYAEAIWSGAEADMGRCVPGGRETQRKLKELMTALEPQRDGAAIGGPAVKTNSPLGSRDRPALATLV